METSICERIDSVIRDSGQKNIEIGNSVGVSGSYIGMVRAGKASPSNAFIISFCRAMNIDETWLRTGVGNPRPDSTLAEDIGRLVAETMTDADVLEREAIVKALVRMGPTGWHHLLLFLEEYEKSLNGNK